MSDSDFDVEDSVELLSLFSDDDNEDGFSVLEIPGDWSDLTTDTLLDFEDRPHEYDQELLGIPGRERFKTHSWISVRLWLTLRDNDIQRTISARRTRIQPDRTASARSFASPIEFGETKMQFKVV